MLPPGKGLEQGKGVVEPGLVFALASHPLGSSAIARFVEHGSRCGADGARSSAFGVNHDSEPEGGAARGASDLETAPGSAKPAPISCHWLTWCADYLHDRWMVPS